MAMANAAADVPEDPFAHVAALARAEKWENAMAAAGTAMEEGAEPDGVTNLLLAIARVQLGQAELASITEAMISAGDPRDLGL